MPKEKLTGEGLNIKQMYRDPFSFQNNYSYYEPKEYSMDTYFEGFNLRQLNTITFGLNQFALGYQHYMFLVDNKTRRNESISEDETNVLRTFDKLYSMVLEVNCIMRKFENTSTSSYARHEPTFGQQYDKDMHGRCWIEPVEKLKSLKYIRYTTKDGAKWGYGPTEEYFPDDSVHINGLNQNIKAFFLWGYWLEYFKIACFENQFKTQELNNFNPDFMNQMFDEALILMKQLHKLKYVTCFDDFNKKLKE
jgi:hypothetical protein